MTNVSGNGAATHLLSLRPQSSFQFAGEFSDSHSGK